MLIPPSLNTKDRREHDLNVLRTYYMVCEDIGICEEEDIQKSFHFLMGWAGNYKFFEEFMIFKKYIDKRKEENKSK